MRRDFYKLLLGWKAHPLRTPLIVRGARQVGKTYIVQNFGTQEFKNVLTLNLETSLNYHSCFESLEPVEILSQIELISQNKIILGETLLFLDEIQQCPKALQSLRYFKEKCPKLHIIAAGSLLEFAIHEENFSFPVGRVQFAKLYPLSFEEYLEARGDLALKEALIHFNLGSLPPEAIHHYLLKRVQEYFIVGGMPAAISAFLTTQSFLEVKYVQKALWDAYESDFGKYAKKNQHRHLRKIFNEIPKLLGDHVKYSRIDPDLPNPSRDIKAAIELLRLSGLLHPIFATSGGALPLASGLKEAIFKVLFLDIGMVDQIMNIESQNAGLMAGPLAEQFVGQELLANSDPRLDMQLFFWSREKSSAEVDYLFTHKGAIYPIEVKAGKSGKLKSLHLFIQEKNAPFGIKISQEPLGWDKQVLSVPFYLISQLGNLIDAVS